MDLAKDIRVIRFLPAYFCAISHLLSLLSQEEPSIPDIIQAVSADQSLTSRLLNVVNSPVYGAVRQIGTIDEAVVRMGIVGLRNLALAVSMNDITGGMKHSEWMHSIATAFIADNLSRQLDFQTSILHFSFVAGLLHDIGKLFLTRRYMLEYQSVYIKVAKGQPVTTAEKTTFGVDHAEVGGMLLDAWNVPVPIVEAIRFHHDPGENHLAVVIYHANRIQEWKKQTPDTRANLQISGLSDEDAVNIYDDAEAKTRDMISRIH